MRFASIRDLRDAYQKARGNPFAPPTPEIEEAMAKWYDETMKTWMGKLESVVATNGASEKRCPSRILCFTSR